MTTDHAHPPAAPAARYRILIGEDHPLVRVGARHLLARSFRGSVIGEADTGQAILDAVNRETWDVLILDIGLPDRSGLEILPQIKQCRPRLPILIFTAYGEDQLGLRLLKAGVAGYLTKETASEELVDAVRRVLAGGKYLSAQLAERIAVSLDSTAYTLPHETLSAREFQVVRLLAAGRTLAEIAAGLGVHQRTVATFRRNILRKLSLRNTQEIVAYAVRQGLLEAPPAPGSALG